MSERSERVGRPSDAPPTPVWRPAWPRSEPQPPLRRTRRLRRSSSGDSRCTKRSGSGRPRRASLANSIVGDSTLTGVMHRSPFRAVERGGSSGVVAVVARVDRPQRGRRQRRSRRRPTRSLRSLTSTAPTDKGDPPPTARYCCAAPALARRQQSLRSTDKPLRSFVAAGQGSLTISTLAPMLATIDGVLRTAGGTFPVRGR